MCDGNLREEEEEKKRKRKKRNGSNPLLGGILHIAVELLSQVVVNASLSTRTQIKLRF